MSETKTCFHCGTDFTWAQKEINRLIQLRDEMQLIINSKIDENLTLRKCAEDEELDNAKTRASLESAREVIKKKDEALDAAQINVREVFMNASHGRIEQAERLHREGIVALRQAIAEMGEKK